MIEKYRDSDGCFSCPSGCLISDLCANFEVIGILFKKQEELEDLRVDDVALDMLKAHTNHAVEVRVRTVLNQHQMLLGACALYQDYVEGSRTRP